MYGVPLGAGRDAGNAACAGTGKFQLRATIHQ